MLIQALVFLTVVIDTILIQLFIFVLNVTQAALLAMDLMLKIVYLAKVHHP